MNVSILVEWRTPTDCLVNLAVIAVEQPLMAFSFFRPPPHPIVIPPPPQSSSRQQAAEGGGTVEEDKVQERAEKRALVRQETPACCESTS